MSEIDVVWEDPPKQASGQRHIERLCQALAPKLRAKPGAWLKIDKPYKSAGARDAYIRHLGPEFEVVSRRNSDGMYRFYVRCIATVEGSK